MTPCHHNAETRKNRIARFRPGAVLPTSAVLVAARSAGRCSPAWRCFTACFRWRIIGPAPVHTGQQAIDLHPGALPMYALFLRRAHHRRLFDQPGLQPWSTAISPRTTRKAERLMIPLLDTLQSIPVLSFLPAVMIAMVALFPSRAIGRGARIHPADLHRPGVEYGLQRVFVPEKHPARDAGSGVRSTA